MERVVVAGCVGSGKSTLARGLAARCGLPLTERDALGVLGSGRPAPRRPLEVGEVGN